MEPVVRFTSKAADRLARRALQDGLSARQARKFSKLLENSPRDRRAYTALAALVRGLEGDAPLCGGQHARILDAVRRQAHTGTPPGARRPAWAFGQIAPVSAVLALALVTGLVLALAQRAGEDRFQARGSATPAGGHVDLRAFCIRNGDVVSPIDDSGHAALHARCRLSDELQLVVTHTAGLDYLLVVGHLQPDEGHARLVWYYPVPPTGTSGDAPRSVQDEPLGQAIRLSVNHLPGQVRVVALFSGAPLDAERIHARLATLDPHDRAAGLAERINVHGPVYIVERRIRIVNEESP